MDTVNIIYYSPTGTSQKIVKEIGLNLKPNLISEFNITELQEAYTPVINDNSLTIIGVPVYGGRVPINAIELLKKFHSNNSLAVIVVVYGNRAFEDSLLELNEIVTNCGFNVIAGAAFIGEHSYSTVDKPIALERPDALDLIKCSNFSSIIQDKLNGLKQGNKIPKIDIPGNYPYKERNQLLANIYPDVDNDLCTLCGICVDACPTGAITIEETIITNGALCTCCSACIKSCPNDARFFDNPLINGIQEKLFSNCSDRKEPEYFI